MRFGDGNAGLGDGNTDFFEAPCRSLSYHLRQGYHTDRPHVKPAPENFLLRLPCPCLDHPCRRFAALDDTLSLSMVAKLCP